MFSKVDYVMVNVSDMGRSVTFYRDTLGLRLKWCFRVQLLVRLS